MKRLFVALPVEGALKDAVLAWQANHVGWPVNWLSGDNLHITVVAPWLEEDENSAISKLDEIIRTRRPTFFVNFFKVVFGPNRFSPRLVWTEGQAIKPLLDLKNDLETILGRSDSRFFRLHLTMGRFSAGDFGPAGLPDLFDRVDWRQEVKSFVLYESIFKSEGGVDYRKIKEFSF